MLHSAFTPLQAADRIAGLLLHLEEAFAPSLTLTTLAVRRGAGASAQVIVHLNDGSRHPLEAGDALVMARCLRDDIPAVEGVSLERGAATRMAAWADSLEAAAAAAELQANAILFGMGRGGDVVPMRQFGGRP